jgi:hypothetical protein
MIEKLQAELGKAKAERDIAIQSAKGNRSFRCVWKPDEDGTFASSCGLMFQFNEQGPTDNDFQFCPKCGHEIIEQPYEEKDEL